MDFTLRDEQRHWQQVAADYARDVLAPIIRDYERRPDPIDRMPWPAIKEASRLGLRTLAIPKEWGGAGADWLTMSLAAEEIGVVDVGTATTFEICWGYTPMLFGLATEAQKERFLRPYAEEPTFLLAPLMTEPDSGSDNSLPYRGVEGGRRTFARRDGDGWIINGRKHFTSSGGCASLYMLFSRTDFSKPAPQATTLFVLGPDTPGFTIVRAHEKSAHRTSPQTEEVFEDMRLTDEHRIGPVDDFYAVAGKLLQPLSVIAAGGFLGTGRGAFELASDFARSRVQGGKPIVEHQAVAMMLAEMKLQLEAARLVVWNAAWKADQGELDAATASLAKVIASEASFEIARLATEIFGGRGIMTDYDIERYLRDATANLHDFGANQIHRLRIAGWTG